MKRPSPWLAILFAGFMSMHATGCFGQFKLTQKIWNFNKNISGNKFVQWLMFLVLSIIPVYGLGVFIDAIVVNSIEFWTGSNPVASADGGDGNTRIVKLSPTDTLRLSRDVESGVMRMELAREGHETMVRYFEPLEDGMVVRDDAGALLLQAQEAVDGDVAITDATGTTLTVHARDALAVARRVYEEGGAQALAQHTVAQASVAQGLASNTCVAR
ncbi:DUF3332 domain-containing protein [Comamonas sp. JC664]|uniref:DUF3332 domain-containing protein n=1 Tax=Comamonas sp. JC664 TaxID=2801917 RepID=UPI00174955F6|nr:DUF3332 domain-containing protein [Comamonas sp. JC664]MBL0697660.1 DUF3332 domain-containing protein [Comamonas sp. JC664]GHG68883.1 hypothetical protein GCM10012319_12520 [Comamonas sp. KCTC 72670]